MTPGLSFGMGLGLATPSKGGGIQPVTPVLEIDRVNDRGSLDGASYASVAALLAAINGTDAAGVYTIGPYVDPASPNLVANGDGSTTAGWTAGNGTVASVGGKLELTGGGSAGAYLSQQLAGLNTSRGYRTRMKVTRATGGPGVFGAQAPAAAALAPSNYQELVGSTEVETTVDLLWASEQPTAYIGIKQNGTSTGKSRLDDVETREALPVQGMLADRIGVRIQDNMPGSVAGTLCLAQLGDSSERNRVRVDAVNGALRFIVTYANVERVNIALGSKAAGEPFDIAVFAEEAGYAMAQLDGGAIQQVPLAALPGLIRLWLGRSFTGESFGAAPANVQVYRDWMPTSDLWLEGDSYVAGSADLTSLAASIQTQTGRAAFFTGSGGSTLTNQRDRVLAHPGFAQGNKLIHWDGQANGFGTLEQDMAKYGAMAAAKTDGKFLFIAPVVGPSTASDVATATFALRTALLAAYPGKSFDAQAFIDGLSSPWQGDGVHLTNTAMDAVANQLDSLGLLSA